MEFASCIEFALGSSAIIQNDECESALSHNCLICHPFWFTVHIIHSDLECVVE